jgi:predicted nucleic acid-binding protein
VPDAYLAAFAIEANAELAACDAGFARFQGLRSFNPAAAQ